MHGHAHALPRARSMPEAAGVIKGYSPDMMCMPYLPSTDDAEVGREAACARAPLMRVAACCLGTRAQSSCAASPAHHHVPPQSRAHAARCAPVLKQARSFERYRQKVETLVGRMSALVVGPGLGDDPGTAKAAVQIIRRGGAAAVALHACHSSAAVALLACKAARARGRLPSLPATQAHTHTRTGWLARGACLSWWTAAASTSSRVTPA